MNAKKERSNTSIRRKDFKSGFAAHIIGVQDHTEDKVVVSCHGNTENHTQSEEDITDMDASTQKMDCDGANTHDQNDCANNDDLFSSFFVPPSLNENVDCHGINNSVILEAQQVVVNETNSGKEMAVAEVKDVAWVPLTPQIQAKVGYSEKESETTNNCKYSESNISGSAAPKCGKSESLIDILKKMCTRDKKPHKRKKIKRHNPKVGPITPCTPKPHTPKPAKKVKKKSVDSINVDAKATTSKRASRRKLDFGEECPAMGQEEDFGEECPAMGQEELMKPQVTADVSSEKGGPNTPKICTISCTQVQEEEADNTISCNGSILNASVAKITNLQENVENVLLIQGDKDVRDAQADFVVKKMQSLCINEERSDALVVAEKKYKGIVDLDKETMVVWNLLTRDDWNKAAEAEALGADHVEYMKRERKLLRNKLDVFLDRMDVVQGNRQFSPWKGSIVDSVVGVFLTQNASDHMSSTAFMALSSRYPPLSVDEQNSRIRLLDQQVMVVESASDKSEFIPEVDPPIQVERRKGKGNKKQELPINWDDLRKQYSRGLSRERTEQNADSINWEAMRQASIEEVAHVIIQRGMSNQLAERIKGFLDRLVRDHGSIDLEWLRNVPPPKAKDYLLSISGLGLKSTECVRLLALYYPAFPVDTNARRFFVRMGWVPLKKLPEGVKLHELNDYPSLDSVQKYMWSRACDNDHQLLYEIHCHSVTIGKSFCTKLQPNCKECPMRDECAHYASVLASNKPRLQGFQANSSLEAPMLTNSDGNEVIHHSNSETIIELPSSPVVETTTMEPLCFQPIIELPPSPVVETTPMESLDIGDIEDIGTLSHVGYIGTLSRVERSKKIRTKKIRSFIGEDNEISQALVAINPNVASFQLPKQKLEYRLRTVHEVCELPDSHPFLATFSKRVHGDRCPYLLAIWTEDECSEEATTCDTGKPSLSREVVEYQKRIKGTILIPCFTANGGRFPLNGTYFQINEVFADHESSLRPIDVPRELIWNLKRRILYCGKNITSICRGMNMAEVAYLFNRGFICSRGFDTKSRDAVAMVNRFHG
uniref:DEMETER-like DNA glycosylase n=1 Tax=Salvia miltiorrhiza TaxID=226208 RepID=A0A2S0NIY8_SALMI|nr:DEMETER-like DNA glycosylase [Salvia miltiorrhiza]